MTPLPTEPTLVDTAHVVNLLRDLRPTELALESLRVEPALYNQYYKQPPTQTTVLATVWWRGMVACAIVYEQWESSDVQVPHSIALKRLSLDVEEHGGISGQYSSQFSIVSLPIDPNDIPRKRDDVVAWFVSTLTSYVAPEHQAGVVAIQHLLALRAQISGRPGGFLTRHNSLQCAGFSPIKLLRTHKNQPSPELFGQHSVQLQAKRSRRGSLYLSLSYSPVASALPSSSHHHLMMLHRSIQALAQIGLDIQPWADTFLPKG